ncbi:probable LRR receptor-like serine/threonine-protein kinase At1g29720, partial [Capsella rubella]|uniref:probable LRR receptor-like serine/threonine-protein kinase At1g29720 n=1 Tax=Capsella rubella TaxID=81985 RepID=UPI000CD554BE
FAIPTSVLSTLHPDELNTLEKIATTLGIKEFNLRNGDPCSLGTLTMMQQVTSVSNPKMKNAIGCDCSLYNNDTCHITSIDLKTLSLPGILPPELADLRYLQRIELCRNYLSGSIPMEWASMPHLTTISVCANNLSGKLPPGLQNFKNLTSLGIEANQFSGPIPDELGNMTKLEKLQLGSNRFTGSLPDSFAKLINLKDFRISDNNFTGIIPGYIGNWFELRELHISASGLKGPIPAVGRLTKLKKLIITGTTGINYFPNITSNAIKTLTLRNVSLYGLIPSYIWSKPELRTLDLSFNKLTGEIHGVRNTPIYTYLTGNELYGDVESSIFLNDKSNIDLSYNNFSWSSSCKDKSNINTYQSSYLKTNLTELLPCAGSVNCTNYQRFLHINCGGDNIVITNSSQHSKITYQADNYKLSAATNQHFKNWGISNTGVFTDDNEGDSEDQYILSTSLSGDSPDIYKTARRSSLSLVYYAFCLENGAYDVKLHFMEIQFYDEELYKRLGRRIFDVYVQGELFLRDFNIKEEANGALKPIMKEKKAVNVSDHMLEIRLYWAGKGTTLIPQRGNYGPLISAISLCHSLEPRCGGPKNDHLELRAQGLQTLCFTWRQLQAATNNFDEANKLGEGGFGSVFKGELSDGTIIAVKQLSSKSCQGNREFVNEIGMISGLNHPNLVKLYGCCVEKDHLLLVYEYMENNSLALPLFEKGSLKLDWAARQKICLGIARGLAFLHEGSAMRMVHRDIKTTNVLLDADLNAKISDFGLARLHEAEHSHISTKIAGTIGYMAPEYALWGQLTEKADVYSFGVVAMEIVSGKSNTKQQGNVSLINWALTLQQTGDIMDIVDAMLKGEFNNNEAARMIKVALVCINSSPSLRPTMSEVVQMLEGEMEIPQVMSGPGLYGPNWSISKLKDIDTHGSSSKFGVTDHQTTTVKSSASGSNLYPLYPESMILNSTIEFSSSSL